MRLLFLACLFAVALAQPKALAQRAGQTQGGLVTIEGVRLAERGRGMRVVIETSAEPVWYSFALEDPYRIVLDVARAQIKTPLAELKTIGNVSAVRFGKYSNQVFRVVLEVPEPTIVRKAFVLKPAAGFPYRLVFDMNQVRARAFTLWRTTRPPRPEAFADFGAPLRLLPPASDGDMRPVIVLDPGHGGIDPGARGRRIQEKNVVLVFAKELRAQLASTGRYRVHLTRTRDIFIPLGRRVDIARRRKADLFISVHADATKKRTVRGMSVYTLSEKASDKEAAALARKENRSDIIAGVDFSHHQPAVASILIDLAQRETDAYSVDFARTLLAHVKDSTKLLERPHRYAGFRVLKAPDVPSVLVELGFMTNRGDESLLIAKNWQRKVANMMVKAIDNHFSDKRMADYEG